VISVGDLGRSSLIQRADRWPDRLDDLSFRSESIARESMIGHDANRLVDRHLESSSERETAS
jgi:hypothetical protein